MIGALISFVIFIIIVGVLWYVVSLFPLPAPFPQIVRIVFILIIVLYLIYFLMGLAGGTGAHGPWLRG
jgi:hypothetical protein